MKRTPFFKPNEKPVRKGIYKTRIDGHRTSFYSYWNGWRWSTGFLDKNLAFRRRESISIRQDKHWRGILKEPK